MTPKAGYTMGCRPRLLVASLGLLAALALAGCQRDQPAAGAGLPPKLNQRLARARRDAFWHPRRLTAQVTLGQTAYEAGMYNDAYAAFHEAVTIDPGSYDACLGMALANAGLHDPSQALDWARRAAALRPGTPEVLQLQGRMLLLSGRFDAAAATLRRALAARPDSAASWLSLSSAYAVQGRYAEAISAARQAVKLRPDDAVPHMALAMHLQKAGQLRDAENEYRAVLRADPANAGAMTALAKVLLDQKRRLPEALQWAVKASDTATERAQATLIAAWIMHLQGDTRRAAVALGKLVGADPHNPEAWAKLALMLRALGEADKADAADREARAYLRPSSPVRAYVDRRDGGPEPAQE
jgi:tetratricopeptide (TPR) repeat protein